MLTKQEPLRRQHEEDLQTALAQSHIQHDSKNNIIDEQLATAKQEREAALEYCTCKITKRREETHREVEDMRAAFENQEESKVKL